MIETRLESIERLMGEDSQKESIEEPEEESIEFEDELEDFKEE